MGWKKPSPVRDQIVELLKDPKLYCTEIARQLSCSLDYVHQVARENGLTIKVRASRRREIKAQERQAAVKPRRRSAHLRERYLAEYQVYDQAKHRCIDPDHVSYKNYGSRGIRFLYTSFAEFLKDVGPRPDGRTQSGKRPIYTLDRINNNGHYEIGNCRWATWQQQARSRRPRLLAYGFYGS